MAGICHLIIADCAMPGYDGFTDALRPGAFRLGGAGGAVY